MKDTPQKNLIKLVNSLSQNLRGAYDLDPMMHLIGDAKYVMLGGSSYGTSDYYLWRARISQRLIHEKCFSFIAVEGDWTECSSINRYINNYPNSGNRAYEVLNNFNLWPSWVWANWETAAFTEWLKEYNSLHQNKVGFYGLDIYDLWKSTELIMNYLKTNYPDFIDTARRAFMCFEPFSEDVESITWAPKLVPDTQENEVLDLLKETASRAASSDPDAVLFNEQNAKAERNAVRYFKTLLKGGVDSWNIRDSGMAGTLDDLMDYYGKDAKGIIWAHNSHVGDKRAFGSRNTGIINLGKIVKEQHEKDGVVLAGLGTYSGNLIAANSWGNSPENIKLPEAGKDSWEEILHKSGTNDKLLVLRDTKDMEEFTKSRLIRTIGHMYNPENESQRNYVLSVLPGAFDAYLYIDNTQAVSPLHPEKEYGTPPEKFPWGL